MDYAMQPSECVVCGRLTVPLFNKHKFSLRHITCSEYCQKEFDAIMEALANLDKTLPREEDNNEF